MQEFLNRTILDNKIREYLIVAVVILIIFLFKKYAAKYAASAVFNLFKLKLKTVDKDSFERLVARPLGVFLFVLVTVIAFDQLRFPQVLDFKIYHIPLKELVRMIATGFIIITFFLFLVKLLDFIVLVFKERFIGDGNMANHQLLFFFKDFIKVLLGILAVLLLLKHVFGYDIKGLITGLSIVGAAVALALKESLENLIASFVIFFDKPFATGDFVKVNNVKGTIEKIGLRSTRIRSEDKTYITVPNKQMVDSVLDNMSSRTQRRADIRLEIDPSTPPDAIRQLLDGTDRILKKPAIENYNLLLNEMSSRSVLITADYYSGPIDLNEFNDMRQTVNMELLDLLDKLNIEIAGTVNTVIISPDSDNKG